MKNTHRRPASEIIRKYLLQLATIAIFSTAAAAHAEWTLNADKSSLNFVTTKAVDINEIQGFEQLTGAVSKKGEARLNIALASIKTGIPIRDERMSEILFESERFPEAVMSTQVPITELAKLPAGESSELNLEGELAMRGVTIPVQSKVQVIKLKDGSLQINSTAPVIVNGSELGLVAGIDKLRELAGLPSIGKSVSVTFQLNFSR